MAKNFYTIRELLKAANQVKGYGASSIAKKELGTIYTFNKVLRVKPRQSIVEISMLIKGVTDMVGTGNTKRPVAAHRVRVLIRGLENEEVTGAELVKRIRAEHPELSDKEKYPNRDILEQVRNGKEFLKNKVTMEVNRVILELSNPKKLVEHGDGTASYEDLPSKWTFAIISKEINPECKIQVKCTCSSYFWTFQYPNGMNNVDIAGQRACKPYSNYATSEVKRNSQNKVGVCKHIMLLLGMLMHERVIKQVQKGKNSPATVYALNMEKFRTSSRLNREAFKDLVKHYKRDLRAKQSSRNAMWYIPKKRKKSKFAPKVPKGTMANFKFHKKGKNK